MQEETANKIKALNEVIREGDVVEQFLQSEAWSIIRRTLDAVIERDKAEAFDKAPNRDQEIRYYLGRQEQAEEIRRILEKDFIGRRQAAVDEKIMLEALDKDQEQQNEIVHNTVNTQPYLGQNPGLMG